MISKVSRYIYLFIHCLFKNKNCKKSSKVKRNYVLNYHKNSNNANKKRIAPTNRLNYLYAIKIFTHDFTLTKTTTSSYLKMGFQTHINSIKCHN